MKDYKKALNSVNNAWVILNAKGVDLNNIIKEVGIKHQKAVIHPERTHEFFENGSEICLAEDIERLGKVIEKLQVARGKLFSLDADIRLGRIK